MADAKISELTTLTSVDEADVLAVVDVSTTQTKKATKAVLLAPITATGTSVGIGVASPTANLDVGGSFKLNAGAHPTGTVNIALGTNSGAAYTGSTSSSVAIGNAAGRYNTGSFNVSVGYQAMLNATTAADTVAIGTQAAGLGVLTGGTNICIGKQAGYDLTSGASNTLVGSFAGDQLATGSNNTILGYQSAVSAIGASNEVVLGNGSVTVLRCQVSSISALSDARDKTEIANLSLGLSYIQRLRPVEFRWDIRDVDVDDPPPQQGQKEAGFLAQELLAAEEAHGVRWLNSALDNNPDRLEATPGKLLPIVVKALQEASAKIDALETRIAALEAAL